MGASKQIRRVMLEKNIKVSELAEKIDMKPQPLSNKLFRDTMSYSDVEKNRRGAWLCCSPGGS